ncbi:MAG: right-handed parallel beta-helix repeat-containing protein [Saprospiraceae bacterium]|uniref:Right-handed parallel beta-helix repeat-containing protein n=1 Tax=Candidatus Opimibacter skivensis TaxID=2982028 RepID=A0A9D7SWB8_9BACT|nr:right-handed parallel beta-helix repeat-containing protein [Candidatus Opimibacter skivensis]
MFSNDDAYITNYFHHNGAGVAVMFTNGAKMFNNNFKDTFGVMLRMVCLLKEISDSYIFNNKFIGNTSGIFMEGTNRIQVEKNIFKDMDGMKIQASCMTMKSAGIIFVRNTFDVSTNGTLVLNTFDHTHWDEYEGYDLIKDSIGDIPYRP